MSSKNFLETFFYIGPNRLSLYVFEGINKKIFEKKILINDYKEIISLNDFIDKFFDENIIKVEKNIGKFINEVNLIISDPNFILIQASIKKDGKGDKIKKIDISRMLFDLKQQIKEYIMHLSFPLPAKLNNKLPILSTNYKSSRKR